MDNSVKSPESDHRIHRIGLTWEDSLVLRRYCRRPWRQSALMSAADTQMAHKIFRHTHTHTKRKIKANVTKMFIVGESK